MNERWLKNQEKIKQKKNGAKTQQGVFKRGWIVISLVEFQIFEGLSRFS